MSADRRSGLIAAAALIAAITAVARVVGFGRWLVFSANVGASCIGEAYASANVLPNVLFEVAAGGALAGAVVPLLAGPIARAAGGLNRVGEAAGREQVEGREQVDRIASALISWALLVLVPLSLVLAALAGPLSRLLVGENCAGQRELTSQFILVFAPQIALYGFGVVLSGVLTAHRRFLAPALAPLLSSLVVIVAYFMYGRTAQGAHTAAQLPAAAHAWLAWGTTVGVLVMTVPLLLPVRRAGVRLRPTLRFPPGVARRGVALAGAGIAALLAQQAAVLVALLLANHSQDGGAFPVFQYAQAVYLLPYAVLAVPIATSAFPRLAERAKVGDATGFAATASSSTRAVALAALFGAAVLAAAAVPVGRFFTEIDHSHGRAAAVTGALPSMGLALTVMAPGLLGFGLIAHLGRVLYALEHGRAAAVATAAGWLVVIAGSVAGARVTGVVVGLAWGNTIGMSVAGALLLAALVRSAGREALAGLARVLMIGAIAAVVAAWAGRAAGLALLNPVASWLTVISAGVGAALVAGLVFVVAVAALDRRDLAVLALRRFTRSE